MPSPRDQEQFVTFMVSYTDFLEKMCQNENDKLQALSSRQLPRIEHSITVSQANAKQLENMESKRMALQAAAGYEGMSFRQLIDSAAPNEQDKLWKLFTRFESNVAEIRFLNDKSMAVARDNMLEIDPQAVVATQQAKRGDNPYERLREAQSGEGALMEKKV